MKSLRSASLCTLLMVGIAGSICGQTLAPRRGAKPVFGGPGLVKETTRVSVDSASEQANFISLDPSVSSDGRYVAFRSIASNLVPLDTNGKFDIFVHDRATGITTRASVDSAGAQVNGDSSSASISSDGRYVAFRSRASNLVPLDTNGVADVFVHDRARQVTTRVSVDSNGAQGSSDSFHPSISSGGGYVSFVSQASTLVPRDTNATHDIFVHDRASAMTTRVSVASDGAQANSTSLTPSITSDGRYVAFESSASNLVMRDTNGSSDIFVHDRMSGTTTRVSIDSAGAQANSASFLPSISSTGRFVSFLSYASNLVPGDTNGLGDIFVHDRETAVTTRASVTTSGREANASSFISSISSDGRFVVFESFASNLVPVDTNEVIDVFVHDRASGNTNRVSVSSYGAQGNWDSGTPAISSDGRHVFFVSSADNLVPEDTNFSADIFVR